MTDINPFYSAKCTPEALAAMQEVREAFKVLDETLQTIQSRHTTIQVPTSVINIGPREMAVAKTNLEQSSMWAIKAISHYNVAKEEVK